MAGTDAVLFSVLAFLAYQLAEAAHPPAIGAYLQPMTRTRELPSLFMRSGGARLLNLWSHIAAEQITWQPIRRTVNRCEKTWSCVHFRGPASTDPFTKRCPLLRILSDGGATPVRLARTDQGDRLLGSNGLRRPATRGADRPVPARRPGTGLRGVRLENGIERAVEELRLFLEDGSV
jgi:hypothetical protein